MRQLLRDLVQQRRTASLGTLHNGEPFVSMVPFAVSAGNCFIVHVSGLAAHTRDMLAHPRVSLMITAIEDADTMPQALPRVTIDAATRRLADDDPIYTAAREAYLTRFPQSEPIFELGDFALFAIEPASLRLVAGFGAASTLSPADLTEALQA
ncbi:MAG: HugZ family pyridoxamine 5'-phosphate oxidase [Thermoanaerobaculia bacterium]